MTDRNYFQYGKRLLETRHIVDADFICYGPDLTFGQIKELHEHDIAYMQIGQELWDKEMQSLKFQFIKNHCTPCTRTGITFVDWDTYFLKDWKHVFEKFFIMGITIRMDFIDKDIYPRAWANGGVIFAQRTMETFYTCDKALECIKLGGLPEIIEYDTIWKTLEKGRKPEKTHHRTNHRWCCDQIFLSALVRRFIQRDYMVPLFGEIKLFDCRQYNNMWQETPETYIMHLKNKSGAPGSLKDGKN